MPELPEVEVLRRSLEPELVGDRFERFRVWCGDLREPVDGRRLAPLRGGVIRSVGRRSKYLLIETEGGAAMIVHLGMSGRLRLVPAEAPREKHEHVTVWLGSGRTLRFRDPRRFGLVAAENADDRREGRRFAHLGIEPLEEGFDGEALRSAARGRRGPVKNFLMNANVVVGVGNIYASESLFRAGIHPARSVARIGGERWAALGVAIRETLRRAIREGGTTLNDFADAEGREGYFQVSLSVYGRGGEDCPRCGRTIRRIVQAGRSTFYCPGCQR